MKIQIIVVPLDNGAHAQVEAEVFGAWAVHESLDLFVHGRGKPRPALAITHVATGLRARSAALVGISKRDARLVARRLNRTFPTLPLDVIAAARGEVELSAESAAVMKKIGEFLFDVLLEPSTQGAH